jgi:hypothetical protein
MLRVANNVIHAARCFKTFPLKTWCCDTTSGRRSRSRSRENEMSSRHNMCDRRHYTERRCGAAEENDPSWRRRVAADDFDTIRGEKIPREEFGPSERTRVAADKDRFAHKQHRYITKLVICPKAKKGLLRQKK